MMTNLFSIFDPSSSLFSMAWVILMVTPLLMPATLWKISSSHKNFLNKFMTILFKEISFTMKKSEKSQALMILIAFLSILMMNISALYPQNFSVASHLTVTLPLSLTFWLTVVLFGWFKNTNHMLSHLVPQGTPGALMMFMVMIELTSNLIRPITLCVRLTANLIAGHLLMTLLGNSLMTISSFLAPVYMLAPMVLTILESAVACIQAYVFMTLITLYTTEVK